MLRVWFDQRTSRRKREQDRNSTGEKKRGGGVPCVKSDPARGTKQGTKRGGKTAVPKEERGRPLTKAGLER